MNKHSFLTYNEWNGDIHKGTSLENKGLNAQQIQLAIDIYVSEYGSKLCELKRLEKLVDELLNENQALKRNQ